jgi:GTP cyclohydrolase I
VKGERVNTNGKAHTLTPTLAPHVRESLSALGEDPTRDGLLRTPDRVERSLRFLTSGYEIDLASLVNDAIFEDDARDLVAVRDIEVFSLCEHHLLPFFGRAHIAYIPDGRILGLSKMARVVEMFARRLQVQERLTRQIAQALHETLRPRGVAVIVEARHLCMAMRGVQKSAATAVTRAATGVLEKDRSPLAGVMSRSSYAEGRDW